MLILTELTLYYGVLAFSFVLTNRFNIEKVVMIQPSI